MGGGGHSQKDYASGHLLRQNPPRFADCRSNAHRFIEINALGQTDVANQARDKTFDVNNQTIRCGDKAAGSIPFGLPEFLNVPSVLAVQFSLYFYSPTLKFRLAPLFKLAPEKEILGESVTVKSKSKTRAASLIFLVIGFLKNAVV